MALLTPTTELEAVNSILSVIAESPIAALDDAIGADSSLALNLLRKTSRQVQSRGWYFNSESEYELAKDGSNKFPLPSNTLRVDASDKNKAYVERNRFMYDLKNHQDTFADSEQTTPLKVEIVLLLDYEDLPEPARHYIMVLSARQFQDRLLGDNSLHVFSQQDERDAKAQLEDMESKHSDRNLATHDPLIYRTLRYRRRGF